MKKIAKLLYSVLFFTICFIPVLTMPFISQENNASKEKREKAQMPVFIEDSKLNLKFFEQLDSYLSDNFNFRDDLITMNAKFMEDTFKTSAQNQVIVGKNDWLYFEKTVSDFSRNNSLSDSEINRIVKVIDLVSEYAKKENTEFIFTIAPNKNSIYPEYMPDNYIQTNGKTNAEKLKEKLNSEIYVDLFKVLSNSDKISYLKRDSHWNNYGAYLGFKEMIKGLGIEKQNFNILSENVEKKFEADLDGMMYPKGEFYDTQNYYKFDKEFKYVSRFKSMDDITIKTNSTTGKDDIIVFRDSFGNALLDYFGRQFENVEFSRAVPYKVDSAKDYDYMVLEIVERNIPNLLKSAPIMPAPQREVKYENLKTADLETIKIDEKNDYNHVYGYFELENVEDIEEIYILIDKNGREEVYEAFPIIEEKLEIENTNNKFGFSAYIPLDLDISSTNISIKYK